MKSGWVLASAAVLVTAGWAAAQTPMSFPTDNPVPSGPTTPVPARPPAPAASKYRAVDEVTPASYAVVAPLQFPDHAVVGGAPSGDGHLAFEDPYTVPAPYRVWTSADFLVWQVRSPHLPSLTSTLPVGVLAVQTQNLVPVATVEDALIQSTPTLAGGNTLNFREQFGARFTAGVWLDPEESFGLEATGFFLSRRSVSFNSTTGNMLNQGIIDLPSSVVVTNLMLTQGPLTVTAAGNPFTAVAVRQATANLTGSSSTGIWGTELNARCTSPSLGAVSGLLGFRFLDFSENLLVHDTTQLFLPPGVQDLNSAGGQLFPNPALGLPANLSFTTSDIIRTRNLFYGGQVGLNFDMLIGRFMIDLQGKTGLGVVHQTVNFFGTTVSTSTPISTATNGMVLPGGLLSSPLDLGKHSSNKIAFVPEINVKLGYLILPNLRAYVGYDFLYLSSAVRPGEQTGISTAGVQATVAGTTTPITVNQPTFRYHDTGVWYNGINFGVEFRY
jgi:hypothetical protein